MRVAVRHLKADPVATPAKKLHDHDVVEREDEQHADAPVPRPAALTPARQDEIIDRIATDWKATFDLLERFDRGEPLPDITSK
jgi:hypothetical protein